MRKSRLHNWISSLYNRNTGSILQQGKNKDIDEESGIPPFPEEKPIKSILKQTQNTLKSPTDSDTNAISIEAAQLPVKPDET